jgi:PAS domain S-box-containing protein
MDPKILKILWEKCVIGLAEVDATGKFTKANPAFCAILGYSEAELQNKTWVDITHPEDAPGNVSMLNKLISGEIEDYSVQKRYITKKGNVVWVDLFIMSIVDETRSLTYFLKQVQTSPVIIPETQTQVVSDKSTIIRDNIKLISAGIIGALLAIAGVMTSNTEFQTLGIGLVVGVFGSLIGKYK